MVRSGRLVPLVLAAALSLAAGAPALAQGTAPPPGPPVPTAEPPQPPTDGPRAGLTNADLAAQIEALDQQLRILERKLELEKEAAAAQAQAAGVTAASADGFVLRSGDGAFVMRLRGLLHADGRFYAGEAATDTFVMRRVRPIVETTLFSFIDARLMPDFGGGTTVLQDAYVTARFRPQVRLRAGKFKPPVGLERLGSAQDLLFVERALPTALVPNRDLGLMLEGDLLGARLLYQAGVFNGVVDGGSADIDDRPGKDAAGRIVVSPFKGRDLDRLGGLSIGLAVSAGEVSGLLATPALPAYRTAGQQIFFRYRSGATLDATTVADGARRRWSPQASYYSGRLGVIGEYVRSSQAVARGAAGATLGASAWQLAGSWMLTGEPNTGRSIRPRAPFDARSSHPGAVELTARVNALTVDDEAFPVFADPSASASRARGWAAGVNWYLNRALKITVDYEETFFRGGADTGRRPAERDLFSRFQVAF